MRENRKNLQSNPGTDDSNGASGYGPAFVTATNKTCCLLRNRNAETIMHGLDHRVLIPRKVFKLHLRRSVKWPRPQFQTDGSWRVELSCIADTQRSYLFQKKLRSIRGIRNGWMFYTERLRWHMTGREYISEQATRLMSNLEKRWRGIWDINTFYQLIPVT